MPDNITPDISNKSTTVQVKPAGARKPRKKPVAKRINAGMISERRLLDSKIVLPAGQSHRRLAKIILVALVLGGLAGAAVLFYLNTQDNIPTDNYIPPITITEDADEAPVAPPAQPETSAPLPAPAAEVLVVEILSTPTNFLNVRKGPGTNFEKIGQVKPGEAYILISQDTAKGWYEIKLADGSPGWVTAQYSKVK